MHREYGDPAPTYDLIRLREPVALAAGVAVPSRVEPALRRTPWVMVRRGYVREGMLPVGARGAARHQRFAAFVAVGEIAERRSPEDLTTLPYAIAPRRQDAVPALAEIITPQGRRYVETFDVAPDDKFYPISSDTTAAVRLTGDALQATFKGPTGQSDAVRCILSADQQVMTCSGVLTRETVGPPTTWTSTTGSRPNMPWRKEPCHTAADRRFSLPVRLRRRVWPRSKLLR